MEIDRRLYALVDVLAAHLLEDERRAVVEFVDVGEYGLALETIVEIFVETERALPRAAFVAIVDLASMMDRQSLISEPLRQRVK